MDIAGWQRELGLEGHEPAFRENEIDAEVLPELTESDLSALGLPIGPRRKLLKAITALRHGAGPPVFIGNGVRGGLRPFETRRHPGFRRYLSGKRLPSRTKSRRSSSSVCNCCARAGPTRLYKDKTQIFLENPSVGNLSGHTQARYPTQSILLSKIPVEGCAEGRRESLREELRCDDP